MSSLKWVRANRKKAVAGIVLLVVLCSIFIVFFHMNRNSTFDRLSRISDLNNESNIEVLADYRYKSRSSADTFIVAEIDSHVVEQVLEGMEQDPRWSPLPLSALVRSFLIAHSLDDVCDDAGYDYDALIHAMGGANGYFFLESMFSSSTQIHDLIRRGDIPLHMLSFSWSLFDADTNTLYYVEYVE